MESWTLRFLWVSDINVNKDMMFFELALMSTVRGVFEGQTQVDRRQRAIHPDPRLWVRLSCRSRAKISLVSKP